MTERFPEIRVLIDALAQHLSATEHHQGPDADRLRRQNRRAIADLRDSHEKFEALELSLKSPTLLAAMFGR